MANQDSQQPFDERVQALRKSLHSYKLQLRGQYDDVEEKEDIESTMESLRQALQSVEVEEDDDSLDAIEQQVEHLGDRIARFQRDEFIG